MDRCVPCLHNQENCALFPHCVPQKTCFWGIALKNNVLQCLVLSTIALVMYGCRPAPSQMCSSEGRIKLDTCVLCYGRMNRMPDVG
jgi:hypothetical protein